MVNLIILSKEDDVTLLINEIAKFEKKNVLPERDQKHQRKRRLFLVGKNL